MKKLFYLTLLSSFFLNTQLLAKENFFQEAKKNYDYDLEKAVPLKAGSCTFHHSLVIHRTDPNKSPNRRIGLTIGYMSAKSKFIGKGPKPEYDLIAGSNFPGCV